MKSALVKELVQATQALDGARAKLLKSPSSAAAISYVKALDVHDHALQLIRFELGVKATEHETDAVIE